MITRIKTCSSTKTRIHGDSVIERAERRGLTEDRSKISPHTVRRRLRPKSEVEYARDLEVWDSYVKKHGPSDPRDMRMMKHFAETMALGTIGKLDDEDELPTPDSLRCKSPKTSS